MKADVMDYFFRLLHPQMTVLVVSVEKGGGPNVMTCSWNMPVSEEPPLIALAISRESLTNELIKKAREFTVNIPSSKLLKAVWISGTRSGREINKIKLAGLKLAASKRVKAPIIEDCIGHLECRLERRIEAGEATIFVGEVLAAYARRDLFKRGLWAEEAEPLLHLGGRSFVIPGKVLKA